MANSRTRRAASTSTRTEARIDGQVAHEEAETKKRPTRGERFAVQGTTLVGYISVRGGVTLNMNDFNHFKRDIGCELPMVLGDVDDVMAEDGKSLRDEVRDRLDEMYDAMADWVTEKQEEVFADAQDFFAGGD